MSRESRMLGGILLVVLPSVMFGGLSLPSFLTRNLPGYSDNPQVDSGKTKFNARHTGGNENIASNELQGGERRRKLLGRKSRVRPSQRTTPPM